MTNPFAGKGGTATKAAPAKAAPARKATPPAKAAARGKPNAKPAAAPADDADEETGGTQLTKPAPKVENPFATAGGGGSDYSMDELTGELLLFRPSELDEMFTSASKPGEGPSPFVRTEIWRVENEFEYIDEMLVFQVALIRALKKCMRGTNAFLLGRLYRGEAKGSKSAPYLLGAAEEDETSAVVDFCSENGFALARDPLL
jgi:hypothetical protein